MRSKSSCCLRRARGKSSHTRARASRVAHARRITWFRAATHRSWPWEARHASAPESGVRARRASAANARRAGCDEKLRRRVAVVRARALGRSPEGAATPAPHAACRMPRRAGPGAPRAARHVQQEQQNCRPSPMRPHCAHAHAPSPHEPQKEQSYDFKSRNSGHGTSPRTVTEPQCRHDGLAPPSTEAGDATHRAGLGLGG
jgi:hypothetical protein